jgi:hypothetical protein
MKKSEIEFCLTSPIKYAGDGGQIDGFKLILKAPSGKNISHRALLKQQLMIAFQWMESQKPKASTAEASPAKPDAKLTEDDIKDVGDALALAIYAAPGVDINRVLGEFSQLLIEGTCSVEGEKDLTRSLFEKISLDDIDAMLGQYLANFIMPS